MTSQLVPLPTVVFKPYDSLLDSEYQMEYKTYEIPARRFHMQKPVSHDAPIWQGLEEYIVPIAEVLAMIESGNPQDWEKHLPYAYGIYMNHISKSRKASWIKDLDHENAQVYAAYKNWRMLKSMYRR